MKAQILAQTGLTEKAFYAKYKSPEDFFNSKEGKAFKKAQSGKILSRPSYDTELEEIEPVPFNWAMERGIRRGETHKHAEMFDIVGDPLNSHEYKATRKQIDSTRNKARRAQYGALAGVDTSIGTTYPSLKNYSFGNQQIPANGNNFQLNTNPFGNQDPFSKIKFNSKTAKFDSVDPYDKMITDNLQVPELNFGNPAGDMAGSKFDNGSFSGKFGKQDSPFKGGGLGSFDFTGAMDVVTGISGAVSEFQAQNDNKHKLQQQNALADLNLQNINTIDVDQRRMDIASRERQRDYWMPEQTGEESFPIYGVGSNVLAQNGGKLTRAQMGGMASSIMGNVMPTVNNQVGKAFNNNAGYQMGSSVGKALKFIPGVGSIVGAVAAPVLGAIGGWADKAFGEAGDIESLSKKLDRTNNQIQGAGVSQGVHQQYNRSLQDGGLIDYNENQETLSDAVQTLGGGTLTPISHNRHYGEVGILTGDIHRGPDGDDGGIPIDTNKDGEPEALAENRETVAKTINGDVVITGNIFAPEALAGRKGVKAKNLSIQWSKKENKLNRAIAKLMERKTTLSPHNTIDNISDFTIEKQVNSLDSQLKLIGDNRVQLSKYAEIINKTAEANGLNALQLSRGKIKKDTGFIPTNAKSELAQYGKTIPMAQASTTLKGNTDIKEYQVLPVGEDNLPFNPVGANNPNAMFKDQTSYDAYKARVNTAYADPKMKKVLVDYFKSYEGPGWQNVRKAINKGKTFDEQAAIAQRLGTDNLPGPYHIEPSSLLPQEQPASPAEVPEKTIPATPATAETTYTPEEPAGWDDYLGMAINATLPMWRPSDVSDFNYDQVAAEMGVLGDNTLDPVWAKGYQPQLRVPYDISLQDKLNAVTSQTRAAQRLAGYNPAAQSIIAGASYDPYTAILGDQFRQNQGFKDQIYSGNIAALNDAQLKNIEIYDRQAGRQSQAKSNLKNSHQLALDSMANKKAQHALENQRIGIGENMYNYRYDSKGRAINMNPLAFFDTQIKGAKTATELKAAKKQKNDYIESLKEKEDVGQNGRTLSSSMKNISPIKMYKG